MEALGLAPAHIAHPVDPAMALEIAAMVMKALHQLLLVGDRLEIDHRQITTPREIAGFVEHIGDAAGHAGREIPPGLADDDDDAARHIFAAVIASAFDDCYRPGIAHGETFAGDAAEIALAGDRAIEQRIADDDPELRDDQRRLARRIDHDASAREALADIVVGFAFELERHAMGEARAGALPGGALELDVDRLVAKPVVAVAPRDDAGQHGAGRAVGIADRHVEPHMLAMLDRLLRLGDELAIEHAIETMILRLAAMDADAGRSLRLMEELGEIEALGLPMRDRFGAVEHLHLADHFVEAAIAHRRHPFAHFLGDEEEEIDDMLGLADEAFAQDWILRGDADGTSVEMALAHHDAARRDQRRGGEAEFVGAEQRAAAEAPP